MTQTSNLHCSFSPREGKKNLPYKNMTRGHTYYPLDVFICKDKLRKSDQGGRQMEAQWWKRHCLLKSPHVGPTLALSLPISCLLHDAQRGTVASNRLAAVFGSRPVLNPASSHLTPEGVEQGSNSHVELLLIAQLTCCQGTSSSDAAIGHTSSAQKKHYDVQSKGHEGQNLCMHCILYTCECIYVL